MGLAKFVWTQMGSGRRKQVGDRLGGTQSASRVSKSQHWKRMTWRSI